MVGGGRRAADCRALALRWRRSAVPTLVVRGAESPLFMVEYAERMAAVNPMIRLVTVPDARHLVHCEQPAAFLDAVIPFLDET